MYRKTLMYKEIISEPDVIKSTISNNQKLAKKLAATIKERNIKNFITIARGSSNNAAACFSFALPLCTNYLVTPFRLSLATGYKKNINFKDSCTFIISQSGQSSDTMCSLERAKNGGSLIVGVTNNKKSPVAQISDFHFDLNVGEEKSVAATKTFIAQLTILYLIAHELGNKDTKALATNIPKILSDVITREEEITNFAKLLKDNKYTIVLSRGLMEGISDELALKLNECSYNFAHSWSAASFIHGPVALLEENVNVILLAPSNCFTNSYIDIANKIKKSGANLYAITDIPEILKDNINTTFKMPKMNDFEASIAYASLVSLIALNVGVLKGINVDTPRGLHKVTNTI